MSLVTGLPLEVSPTDSSPSDLPLSDLPLSDEELTALALAADPDQQPDEGAVPLPFYQDRAPGGLPPWYMPPVVVRRWRGWRLPVVLAIIGGFLLVDALGFCITYGQLVFA